MFTTKTPRFDITYTTDFWKHSSILDKTADVAANACCVRCLAIHHHCAILVQGSEARKQGRVGSGRLGRSSTGAMMDSYGEGSGCG